jgi:glycosyltransferase involved in cell wall biosynthesis
MIMSVPLRLSTPHFWRTGAARRRRVTGTWKVTSAWRVRVRALARPLFGKKAERMAKQKLLFVVQRHPLVRPGGAEGYAFELYKAIRDAGSFEPVFLARNGPPISTVPHERTPFSSVGDDPNQYFLYTDVSDYDWLFGRSPRRELNTHFPDFLLAQEPDIVHFQHTMFIGYDIIRMTRNALPGVPIVYTLHEYMPICYRNGQMVRTMNNELCRESSPRRCHECFPGTSQQTFFMRKRFIQSHLSLVDQFVTFSPYTLERYVEWGIPREKIRYEPHGHPPANRLPDKPEKRPRNRFGFFGQLTAYKGADVLLRAMAILGDDFDGHLWVHGANLDAAPPEFQKEFRGLLEAAKDKVTFVGQYDREELPKLMSRIDWVVVPSIWWETGPLTVGEAFMHGRPVICSDIGGMAEKVQNGVSGLHFRRGDPEQLAQVMRRAATRAELWKKLRSGIPSVRTMDDHAAALTQVYSGLLAGRGHAAGDSRTSREVAGHV